jgi:ribosomal protein L37AE/L43A
VLKSKKWLEKKSAPRPTEDTRDSASDLGGIVPGDLPVTSHSDSHVTSPSGKQTSNVIKTPQDSTKGNDKTKTNQPAQSDALVGRLALLFRGKTGKNLGSTTEQRTSIAILAHQNGQEDVIASFERWLKREPGMDRIKWPLAVFVNEYSSFSPQQQKRIESERREELAKQFMERNCPLCHTKGQMCNEGNGFVSCGSCGVVLDAAETHDFGQPFVRGRKGG